MAGELTLENLRQAVREEIRGEVVPLHEGFSSLREDVTSLRGEVESLHNDIGALQKDVGVLHEEVGALRNGVGALNEEFISAQSEMTAFRVKVSGQFTEVKQSIEGVRTITKHLALHAGE